MKKLFAILAVAGFLTACNDGGNAEVKGDSTVPATTVDTPTTAPVDTTTKAATDTTAKAADTTAHH